MRHRNLQLKEDYCFCILDENGAVNAKPGAGTEGIAGFFFHDTRHLSRYQWHLPGFDLIHCEHIPAGVIQYLSRFANHEQQLLVRRTLRIRADGFDDEIEVQNSGATDQFLRPSLSSDADFVDVFELRGHQRIAQRNKVVCEEKAFEKSFFYTAQDGARLATHLKYFGGPLGEELRLAGRSVQTMGVSVTFQSCLFKHVAPAPKINWNAPQPGSDLSAPDLASLKRARSDLEMLALSTPQGLCIAAGIPNFVTVFGRDSLISAWFLLEASPGFARGVLRFLAARQGRIEDAKREEQPGRILHEYREGELCRLAELPFAAYFGTVDATPIFIRVLADYVRQTGDLNFARELEPAWRSALHWVQNQRDRLGFLRHGGPQAGEHKGLINQSWKDSNDSMSYSEGTLAHGSLAVVEVQGYVHAAFEAGAYLNKVTGGSQKQTAQLLALRDLTHDAIEEHFWIAEKGIYALALDQEGRQLDVASSGPGHLLWSGAVSKERAAALATRLFQKDLWSGWGVRTLGTGEVRFNPLSYHNGSVWPHDTALFAAGLHRYGRHSQFSIVREALLDLSRTQPDFRIPELVGGYARDSTIPPLPYIESCRPQAWAAAALIYVMQPLQESALKATEVAVA